MENLMLVASAIAVMVLVYGVIGAIIMYKNARTKKDAVDAFTGNLKVTAIVEIIILIGTLVIAAALALKQST